MEIPRRLYMLPFDHRESFEHRLFGFTDPLDAQDVSQIADAKSLIYEGFLLALETDVPRDAAAILVDEQFGDKCNGRAPPYPSTERMKGDYRSFVRPSVKRRAYMGMEIPNIHSLHLRAIVLKCLDLFN